MNFQFGTVDQYLMRTKGEDLKLILSPPLWMEPRIVMSEPCHAKRKIRNGCCDIHKRMMLLKFFWGTRNIFIYIAFPGCENVVGEVRQQEQNSQTLGMLSQTL